MVDWKCNTSFKKENNWCWIKNSKYIYLIIKFIDLRVNLVKEKEKLLFNSNKSREIQFNNPTKSKIKFKNQKEEINTDNNKKPKYEEIIIENSNISYEKIKEQLEKKQVLYDKLKSKTKFEDKEMVLIKESSLVDFDAKRKEEKEKTLNKNKLFDTNSELTYDETELYIPEENIKERVIVKQSYDKILSFDEKKALSEIKEEEADYKNKIELLRRKKNIEREERLERIKKMRTGD